MKYVASSISQMTDYNKYYVYTGHEEGMVTGCWYFWSGTEWLIGGDYQCGIDDIIETSSTMDEEGMPADAKAVGDMIVVSDTEPTSPHTELWIDPDTESVLVPTMDDIEGTYAKKSEVESTYARKAAVGSPLRAATASAMTDVTKIYVYTGSESGYTSGHWYYYDGSSWSDGGVYNSVAFVTDKTLTGDGEAADAKVTGDEITDLKSAISKSNLIKSYSEFEMTVGGYVNTNGGITQANDFSYSDYISVDDVNEIYTVMGYDIVVGAYYDSDYNFLEIIHSPFQEYTPKVYNLNPPSRAVYFRFSNRQITMPNADIVCRYIYNIDNINQKKFVKSSNLIVGSGTDNIFDKTIYTTGIRGTDVSPYFKDDQSGAIISGAMFVKGCSDVTVRSSNTCEQIRYIVFTSKPIMSAEYVVGTSNAVLPNSNGVQTDYHVSIPDDAVYMYYTLKTRASSGDNWDGDTIAFGTDGTDDSYSVGDDIKGIIDPDSGNALLINSSSGQSSFDFKSYENIRVESEFTPLSIGASSNLTMGAPYPRTNILFFSDSHIDLPRNNQKPSLDNVRDVVDFANNVHFDLDVVINGGDIITDSGITTITQWKDFLKPFFDYAKESKKPFLYTVGNHDTNDWSNSPSNIPTLSDWGDVWYDWAETNTGIVRQTLNNKKSTWYYKDIDSKKIRIISVDVMDVDHSAVDGSGKPLFYGGKAWYISNTQMTWLINEALNFDSKDELDWGVVVVIHQAINSLDQWYSTNAISPAYESSIEKFKNVCVSFNTQSTYSDNYTFTAYPFYNLNINADFTRYASETKKPYMICWLVGHEHYDSYKTVDGINMIWTLNGGCYSGSADSRVVRLPNTTTQNSFDLISIDSKERKIRVVKYGAGINCFGEEPYDFMPNGLSF